MGFIATNQGLQVFSTVVMVCFAIMVIFVRLKASKKPTSAKKIIIPPLGMSTGFLMFLAPQMRVPWVYAITAFVVGLFLSYPLIATSHMHRIGGEVYLKRSKSFVLILLTLLVLRLILHSYVEEYVTIPQTGALFFILAFGMILPWRVAMLWRYQKILANR